MPISGDRFVNAGSVSIRCSFCSRNQDVVRKLIASEGDAFICDACVQVCQRILLRDRVNQVVRAFRRAAQSLFPRVRVPSRRTL